MNFLIVVAHPDDEVLGAGATIYKLINNGHKVAVATLANHAAARANISTTLKNDQRKAFGILGINSLYCSFSFSSYEWLITSTNTYFIPFLTRNTILKAK